MKKNQHIIKYDDGWTYGRNGIIRDEGSYGNDTFPPKDKNY